MDDILNMTNKEAAEILKNNLNTCRIYARGNGKTRKLLAYEIAMLKAIKVLEEADLND